MLLAVKRLELVSGLDNKVCDETVRNLLKNKWYKFLHSRKKGLLKALERKTEIFQNDEWDISGK